MRVLHVTRTFSPAVGGLERVIEQLVLQQRRSGIDARVVTLDRPAGSSIGPLASSDTVNGIPVERIAWRGSPRYPFAPTVLQHLHGADLLHVHAIDFFFDFLAAMKFFHRKPIVASTHGGFFHTNFMRPAKVAWFNTLTRASVAAYDGLIAISASDAKLFSKLRPRQLRCIPNGVDIHKWSSCGSSSAVKCLLYFGRFASHKRISILFSMLRALRESDPLWTLVVAGSPAGISVEDLREQSRNFGEAVQIVESPTDAELADLIARSSYFVCASSYEGFGVAAVEAMSAGLVPVLSDIPPFRELIGGVEEGILFEPEDIPGLVARISAFHERLISTSQAIRQRLMSVSRRFEWTQVSKEHLAFYESLLPKPCASGTSVAVSRPADLQS